MKRQNKLLLAFLSFSTGCMVVLLVPLFMLFHQLILPAPTAIAKPLFSLPSIRSIKRKFIKKRRRRTKKKTLRQDTKPAQETSGKSGNLARITDKPDIEPPLPVRNPNHVAKQKAARALPALQPKASAFDKPPPLPERRPRDQERITPKKATSAPAVKPLTAVYKKRQLLRNISPLIALPPLPARKPVRHPSDIDEGNWAQDVIESAIEQCASLGITAQQLPPFKEGLCGNPAPVQLTKIGDVTIYPAATLSCPMVAALAFWIDNSIQVEAKKHLGKKVVRLRNVSSYVCRNRNGDTTSRISEHAYANALDIASFELEDGDKITPLADWNSEETNRSSFLHAIHKAACGPFGTVLGPDANAAHQDHFHVDMAPRKRSSYCR
jgi:hypothetical protein